MHKKMGFHGITVVLVAFIILQATRKHVHILLVIFFISVYFNN